MKPIDTVVVNGYQIYISYTSNTTSSDAIPLFLTRTKKCQHLPEEEFWRERERRAYKFLGGRSEIVFDRDKYVGTIFSSMIKI